MSVPDRTYSPEASVLHQNDRRTIGYVVSRFPKVSETFVLFEMVHLMERYGIRIELFALFREREQRMHPEAAAFLSRMHCRPLLSPSVFFAQLYWLLRAPFASLMLWYRVVSGTLCSHKMLLRSLVVVPKAFFLAKAASRLHVPHLHAHFATHAGTAVYCISKLTGATYSLTAHSHDLYMRHEVAMLEDKIRSAAVVVTISSYNRRLLASLLGESEISHVRVIRCGVDTKAFEPRRGRAGTLRTPVISCVASLREFKGHRYLLQACSLLGEQGVAYRCRIAGDGPLRQELHKLLEELSLQDTVRLLGAQPHHRVRGLLSRTTVYAHPSIVTDSGIMEGIPVALMEAMAMELPVIATNLSGVPELVEDRVTGLLVPEKNSGALANAIRELVTDTSLARRLARAGRDKVLAEYDRDKNTEELYKCFANLTDSVSKPQPANYAAGVPEAVEQGDSAEDASGAFSVKPSSAA